MRRACVKHGPFVVSGSALVPERFRDSPPSHRGRQKWFLLGRKTDLSRFLCFPKCHFRHGIVVTELSELSVTELSRACAVV